MIKDKSEFVYKSSPSRYMHNQMLVYRVFILQLGKNPSQLILPYFCTQVCEQHDPFPSRVTERLPCFTANSSSNHNCPVAWGQQLFILSFEFSQNLNSSHLKARVQKNSSQTVKHYRPRGIHSCCPLTSSGTPGKHKPERTDHTCSNQPDARTRQKATS